MIKDLVSGKEASALVVIKDCLTARGENLLLCWSRQLSQRVDVVVSLHCGTTEKFGCETLDIDCLNGLQCKLRNLRKRGGNRDEPFVL